MGEIVGIVDAAQRLGISRGELLALQRQDLIPWVGSWGLPRFDTDELDRVRPRVGELLAEAERVERAATPEDSIEKFAGSLDERSYPPDYLEEERRGWK
jgi:hypothetical protein